ncbi:MAG: UDP-N-acetylmuramoyl-tripeptide--D-alanyl-D-alanine ligase [Brevinematia bacterium]
MMITPDFLTESLGTNPIIKGSVKKDVNLKISIDSRTIAETDCFIAIKGERFDGHNFIEECFKKGVRYFVINRFKKSKVINRIESGCIWCVNDTIEALERIAKAYKREIFANTVAITGSSGKTTVRELIYSILSKKYNVHTARKNYNNEIGLPLTILEAPEKTNIFVLELGMNHRGEISRLSRIIKPFASVITNIGYAHIGNLGSRKNIAKAKAEIFDGMNKGGYVFLNRDDDYYAYLKRISPCEVIDFSSSDIKVIEDRGIDGYVIDYEGEKIDFVLPGRHNLSNLACALKVGEFFRISKDKIIEALSEFRPVSGRSEVVKSKVVIINDSYNANPASMKAAFEILSRAPSRKIAVISDMLELGKDEVKFHEELGNWIDTGNFVDVIFAYGKLSKHTINNIKNTKIIKFWFEKKEDLIKSLISFINQSDTILIKASHGMRLDEVFEALKEKYKV